MSPTTALPGSPEPTIAGDLRRLATPPDWLRATLQPQQVIDALQRHVPELSSGSQKLVECKVKRLHLQDDDGHWTGTYQLTVEGPQPGSRRVIQALGSVTAPALRPPADDEQHSTQQAFGSDEWRCWLPELGLSLQTQPPDAALPAMPQLTEPEQARALLEQAISAGAPAYHDLHIQTCTPKILSYKPGSRCTILYHLQYAGELAGRGWPTTVIAKTYRKASKAQNAYDGMLALWHSALAAGDVVTIAEPLACIPDLKVMVQGAIAEERTLEDLLKSTLSAGTAEAQEELYYFMRKTAAGLAAFHRSEARHGDTVTLEERFQELHALIDRLAVPVPEIAGALTPLLERLEALAAEHPAEATVPTHGTFNPEQVLIFQQQIGFIDFDDFCLAEPALDVALFRAAIKDTGMNALDEDARENRAARLARLDQLEAIGEVFLAQYEVLAPISRRRVALWEAWSYFRDSLHYWIKVKPAEPDNALMTLEHQLRRMG